MIEKIGKIIPYRFGGSLDNYWKRLLNWWYFRHFRRLIREVRPHKIMEIGICWGDSARMMIKESRKVVKTEITYYGFDLFTKAPEYEQSLQIPVSSKEEIEELLSGLNFGAYHLFKGNTKKILSKVVLDLPKMDLIYIDGGKSYETVKSDWENCKKLMHDETVVVFDDYGVPIGITKVVDEIGSDYDVRHISAGILREDKKQAVVRRSK